MKFKEFLAEKDIKDISKLDAEKQAELFNEFNSLENKRLEELIENKATKKEITALKDEIAENIKKQMDSLNEILKVQGIALKKFQNEEVKQEKSFAEQVKESLDSNKEALKKLRNSNSSSDNVKLTVKAAGDMSISGNVTSGQVPQAYRIPGLNTIASRQVRLFDLVSTGLISSNLVEWVYQANKDGAAGSTAEGAAKNKIDFDLTVGSERVEKYTAYITVTDEMLEDVDYMATEINNELTRELLKAVETGAYSGNGTSPNMRGISTVATAFDAGTFANTIDKANEVDVLTVASNQIKIAEQGMPSAILMHPSDVTSLKMVKVSSTDSRYVERLAMVAGSLSLDGIPIIESTLVTQGTYLIGDFSKASILTKKNMEIEIGYNADNFVKNYKTVRAEWRGVTYVKHNDRTAFVKGTFATDKAALETP